MTELLLLQCLTFYQVVTVLMYPSIQQILMNIVSEFDTSERS